MSLASGLQSTREQAAWVPVVSSLLPTSVSGLAYDLLPDATGHPSETAEAGQN
jgi:hypothetical protein